VLRRGGSRTALVNASMRVGGRFTNRPRKPRQSRDAYLPVNSRAQLQARWNECDVYNDASEQAFTTVGTATRATSCVVCGNTTEWTTAYPGRNARATASESTCKGLIKPATMVCDSIRGYLIPFVVSLSNHYHRVDPSADSGRAVLNIAGLITLSLSRTQPRAQYFRDTPCLRDATMRYMG